MKSAYDRRIARAQELAAQFPQSSNVLDFYRRIALFQKSVFEGLAARSDTDVRTVLRHLPALTDLIETHGPARLAEHAVADLGSRIVAFWDSGAKTAGNKSDMESDIESEPLFFARALLQPYAEWLATRGNPPQQTQEAACPFCGGRPVAGVLRGEGDGAKRSLICSLCATEWQYRRIVCPNCGERNKDHLPVYTAAGIDYVRVEACDVCKTYIKSVDLTRNGHAIPVVDELATVALNIWADEHGYVKLETNLLGM
jgi:FdhE protein